jgi:hypothetical protein
VFSPPGLDRPPSGGPNVAETGAAGPAVGPRSTAPDGESVEPPERPGPPPGEETVAVPADEAAPPGAATDDARADTGAGDASADVGTNGGTRPEPGSGPEATVRVGAVGRSTSPS